MSYSKSDPNTIRSLFSRIAPRYDLGNAILSFWLYRLWNRRLIKEMGRLELEGDLVDLCAGTGDIALGYLRKFKRRAILVDFCQEMLELAKRKAPPFIIETIVSDARFVPLTESSAALISTAYGVRNIEDLDGLSKEVARLLKGDGQWMVLELTRPKNPVIRLFHQLFVRTFVPLVGGLISRDLKAYAYLARSIRHLPKPQELAESLACHGLKSDRQIPLFFGTATLFILKKESE